LLIINEKILSNAFRILFSIALSPFIKYRFHIMFQYSQRGYPLDSSYLREIHVSA
jgi:hypothetical protein